MYDLLSIGTLGVDLYYQSESYSIENNKISFVLGDKYLAESFFVGIGGGATNVAIGCEKHGLRTSLMAKIGNNPFKKLILDRLNEERISHLHCDYEDNYHNVSSIFLTSSGERTVLNYHTNHQHFLRDEKDLEPLKRANNIFLGNLPDVSWSERLKMLHYAKQNGAKIFVNLGLKDCKRDKDQLDAMIRATDVLILNSKELAEFMKISSDSLNIQKVISHLNGRFYGKVVVVTHGSKGSYAFSDNAVFYQPALEGNIIDTLGAGDGYTSGFISKYIEENDIKDSMLAGAEYAKVIIGKIGAN
ncbi:MAG: carbohydrate kinase family protein [Candidatus Roizmanbacteria bacterium]